MLNWQFIRQVGPVKWTVRYSVLQINKRVLKKDSRLRLPTGITITLPKSSGSSTEAYVTNANMDWGAERVFVQYAASDRDFLDIGSHVGYYATYLAPRVRRVYAFEPSPKNLPFLEANAALAENIEVVGKAVSSFDGTAPFFFSSGSATGSLNNVGGPVKDVQVTKVDTFVELHPEIAVGIVKTDVEGHDIEALRGMEATIKKHRPLILTECEYSSDLAALCEYHGYGIFGFVRDRKTQKLRFENASTSDFGNKWLKMLFLVPPHLQSDFAERCGSSQ